MSEWARDIDKMKPQQVVGVLYIESRELKKRLAPVVDALSRRLTGVLKSIAATQCSGALADFSRCVGALREQPATLRDFAGWLESCAAAHSEAASLARRTARVEDMYRLLTSYDVKVSTDAQVQLDELRRVQGCYAEETTTAEAQKDEKLSGMSAALEGRCARLRAKSEQLDQRLRRGVVETPTRPRRRSARSSRRRKALDAAEEKARRSTSTRR